MRLAARLRFTAIFVTVTLLVVWLSGCVPAAQLVDPSSLVHQIRQQPPTAEQALEPLCTASYRDVVAVLGERAGEMCGG